MDQTRNLSSHLIWHEKKICKGFDVENAEIKDIFWKFGTVRSYLSLCKIYVFTMLAFI